MSNPKPIGSDPLPRVAGDIGVVAAGTVLCAALAIHFDWTEALFVWTRRWESLQLDELTFVLLSLAVGLAWFAVRRWRGTRRELKARLGAQKKLALTLDEQRRLAQQFVDLQERERKRLSQELHDELGQFINAIKLDAVAIRAVSSTDGPRCSDILDRARSIIANADLVHKSVARLIRELRPIGLDELGLTAAIEHCINMWRGRLEPARITTAIDERVDGLGEERTLAVYRTVQEALTNCARHANANRVHVRVEWHDSDAAQPAGASVCVQDDGIGTNLAVRSTGLGLIGMRERMAALGGSLSIESAPQAGFRLVARVPAAARERD
jgi:two-component system, NarL family, sensor histidine kinase UhpB